MSGLFRPPVLLGVAALAAALVVGWAFWRAGAVLDNTASRIRQESQIGFSDRLLDRSAAAGVEHLISSAAFRDAALFRDSLWIAASGTLFEYSPSAGIQARFRAGAELPPAPLTRLIVAPIEGQEQLIIATQGEGWLLYDGRALRHIRPQQPEHRKITALLHLQSGELLIGTEKAGVLAWSGATLRPYHDSLTALPVTALAGTFDDLWIGTLDRGALHLRAGQLDRFQNELPDPRVFSLAVHQDSAFIGTSMGVAEIRAGRFYRSFADGEFAKALHYRNGRLLIGTMENGVLQVGIEGKRPRPAPLNTADEIEVESIRDAHGRVMAITRDAVYIDGKREVTAQQSTLSDSNIAALAVEPSGRAWVGYFDRGLDLIEPSLTRSAHIEDENVFCVNRIVPVRDGAVIATANGLVLADRTGKPRQVLTRKDGLIANHVTDVLVEPSGMVAATPAGITFLSTAGAESIYAFHGLVNNHVYCLGALGNRLLAGTLGGISLIDDRIVRASFTTSNSPLRHNWISALTRVGDDWFAGTYGAGVYRFDGAHWESFSDLREGFEVNPNAMAATEIAVYAGTLGRGIAVYNRATSRWAFHIAGLPSTNVTALAVHGGSLWAGTDNGLVRFEERSLLGQ